MRIDDLQTTSCRKTAQYSYENMGPMEMFLTCCKHIPPLPSGTEVINTCPGCDKRYRENYQDSSTVSLWEVIAKDSFFPFPDYGKQEMTIIDACPTRDQTRVHNAVRKLVSRMNISLVEPEMTRAKSTCCGDVFWGSIPTAEVVEQMKRKASEMPVEPDTGILCFLQQSDVRWRKTSEVPYRPVI